MGVEKVYNAGDIPRLLAEYPQCKNEENNWSAFMNCVKIEEINIALQTVARDVEKTKKDLSAAKEQTIALTTTAGAVVGLVAGGVAVAFCPALAIAEIGKIKATCVIVGAGCAGGGIGYGVGVVGTNQSTTEGGQS